MKKNIKWFSLVIAMWLVIVISLLAFTILEYIIPFSRDVKWIENSSKAYYQANSWIEEWLYQVYERNYTGGLYDDRNEFSKWFSGSITYSYTTSSTWNILPPAWEGNSEYDKDWNIISSGNPIQLSIWSDYIWTLSDFRIAFKVPNIDGWGWETLSWWTLPIINWQLSTVDDTLNSSWSIIKAQDINDSEISLNTLQWVDLEWNETSNEQLWNFYRNNCEWTSSWCVLKFSVINKLETDNIIGAKILPYLEWKLTLNNTDKIPLSHTKLDSSGKSYGFKKDISIKIPAPSVNEAFDFTVFQ